MICGFQTFWGTGNSLYRFLFKNITNQFLNPLVSPKSWVNKLLHFYNVLCEVPLFAWFESATCSYSFMPSRSHIKKRQWTLFPVQISMTLVILYTSIIFSRILENRSFVEYSVKKQVNKLKGGKQKNTTTANFTSRFHPHIYITLQFFILKEKLHSLLTPHTVNL